MPHAILYSFAPMTRPHGPTREQQQAQNRAYAEQIGADIVGEFHDAHGGELSDLVRPELKKVMALLEAGQADCVICYSEAVLSPTSSRARRIIQLGDLLYSTSGTPA